MRFSTIILAAIAAVTVSAAPANNEAHEKEPWFPEHTEKWDWPTPTDKWPKPTVTPKWPKPTFTPKWPTVKPTWGWPPKPTASVTHKPWKRAQPIAAADVLEV